MLLRENEQTCIPDSKLKSNKQTRTQNELRRTGQSNAKKLEFRRGVAFQVQRVVFGVLCAVAASASLLVSARAGVMRLCRIYSVAMPIAGRRLTLLKVLLGSHASKGSGLQPRHRACQPRKSILKKDESVERTSRKLTWKDVQVPRGSTDASPSQHLKSP